jgi:predicted DsbA family dithiol-disulfide isomerase
MARFPLVDFRLKWRPYELAPSSGAGRTLRKVDAYVRFMGSRPKVVAYFERLRLEGAQTGIAFEFDGHTSSSFDAHRLMEWCIDTHSDSAADRLMESLMVQYFERGQPPNALEAQLAAAAESGLDVSAARSILTEPRAFADETQRSLQEQRAIGVRGVPAFRLAGEEVAVGAQSADFWEGVLREHLRRLRAGEAASS